MILDDSLRSVVHEALVFMWMVFFPFSFMAAMGFKCSET